MKRNVVLVRGAVLGREGLWDIGLEDGRVASIRKPGPRRPDIGSNRALIAPTLFDIQVNGYAGVDLQGPDVLPEDVAQVDEALARVGVSHWIPTLITSSFGNMEHGCAVVAAALRDKRLARRIPGVHLEGPYISPQDGPRGAHDRRFARNPDLRELDKWQRAADGRIAYVTLAPETDGAGPFIRECARRGIVVSLGHHNATAEQIARAVDAGARMCTHLGNGLAAQLHRHINPLWPQLAEDRLSVSLIADLEHLPPEMLRVVTRVKGPQRTMITSDAVHIAGMRPGHYRLAGTPVELKRSGRICLSGTELLAGSATTLLQGVFNLARYSDFTLEQAFASASRIPAEVFGIRHRFEAPTLGAKATFLVSEVKRGQTKDTASVLASFVEGERVV